MLVKTIRRGIQNARKTFQNVEIESTLLFQDEDQAFAPFGWGRRFVHLQ